MKRREKIFVITSVILFFVTFVFLNGFIESAKAVGDAPIVLNSELKAIVLSIGVIILYSVIYYFVYLIVCLFRRMNKKQRSRTNFLHRTERS
jgi:uncharacterized membrane protein (DUF485 family)